MTKSPRCFDVKHTCNYFNSVEKSMIANKIKKQNMKDNVIYRWEKNFSGENIKYEMILVITLNSWFPSKRSLMWHIIDGLMVKRYTLNSILITVIRVTPKRSGSHLEIIFNMYVTFSSFSIIFLILKCNACNVHLLRNFKFLHAICLR